MAKEKKEKIEIEKTTCKDEKCPYHGTLSLRGRVFRGTVTKKFPKRVVVEFERTVFIRKYERYAKSKTKLHARLPDCLADTINIGDYIEIMECRPLSKIIAFVVIKKIRSKSEEKQ
jgi:small subunit ribosomal protein S17